MRAVLGLAAAGALLLVVAAGISMASFRGVNGESYDPRNHFVSELGWAKAAPAATLFNVALVLGSLGFVPMMVALGRHLRSGLGWFGMGCGMVMLMAGAGVGLVPMDDLVPHLWVANVFFFAYLATLVFFTAAFCPRLNSTPSVPMIVVGTIGCVCSLAFILHPHDSLYEIIANFDSFDRPPVWWLAIWEWALVGSALIWGATAMATLHTRTPTKVHDDAP